MSNRGWGRDIRPSADSDEWFRQQSGWCDARGAGVSGTVILDGVGFSLPNHTPLPGMTIEPGGALAAWLQTDPGTFTGYPGNNVNF